MEKFQKNQTNRQVDKIDSDKQKKIQLSFIIPGLPPSYNRHFQISYNLRQVYLTKEAQQYKRKTAMYIPPCPQINNTIALKVCIEYHSDWFYKNGKIKKKDIQNLDKLLLDVISARLGFNDSQFFIIHAEKIQDKEEFTEVMISSITL